MSIDVLSTIEISRPASAAGRYLSNCDNDPDWIGGVLSARMVTTPPLREGSRVSRVASFLGRQFEYETEVIEYEPDRRIVMRAERPFRLSVSYEIAEAGDGCVVTVRNQGDVKGFYRLAAPLLARAIKRNVDRDLVRLKAILEAQ